MPPYPTFLSDNLNKNFELAKKSVTPTEEEYAVALLLGTRETVKEFNHTVEYVHFNNKIFYVRFYPKT